MSSAGVTDELRLLLRYTFIPRVDDRPTDVGTSPRRRTDVPNY
jgi:hypothetical protein